MSLAKTFATMAATVALSTGCAGMKVPVGGNQVTMDRDGQVFNYDTKDGSMSSFGPRGTCKAWWGSDAYGRRVRQTTGAPCR